MRIKRFMVLACALILALNLFDYISTSIVLQNGGKELNPFVNWVMGFFGIHGGLLITKIPFLSLLIYATYKAYIMNLTRREYIVLPCCYSIVVLFYGYFMYAHNFKYLFNIV